MTADEAWSRLLVIRSERDATDAGLFRADDGRWGWHDTATPAADELADLYAPLCVAGSTLVCAQLGQSLDGCIATRTGDANFVTGEEDRRHLHRLRALVDAVVVGAGTVVADDPQLTVRAVAGANPVRVVVDPRGRVPPGRRVFTDGAASTLWLLGPDTALSGVPSGVEVVRLELSEGGRFTVASISAALADRGLGRVLVEGGGSTVSQFLDEGQLDRLYLTVAPVVIGGGGVPGLRPAGPGPALMRDALRPPTRRFPLGDDVLFELDLAGCRRR